MQTHFCTHGIFYHHNFVRVIFLCTSVSIPGSCGGICKGPLQRRNSFSSWVRPAETQSAKDKTKKDLFFLSRTKQKIFPAVLKPTVICFQRPTAAIAEQKRSTHISSEVQRTRPDSQIKSGTCQLLRQAGTAAPRLIPFQHRRMYQSGTFSTSDCFSF